MNKCISMLQADWYRVTIFGSQPYESPQLSSRSLAIQEPLTVKETDAQRGPERDEEQEKQGYSGASGP